jgi:uncharacterized membrane protein
MTNFPELVETVDNRQRLTLPLGQNEIDYFFGISGPAQSAQKAIDDVTSLIAQANNNGIKVTSAQEKLDLAISAYEGKKYDDAEKLALEGQELARNEIETTTNPPPNPSISWFSQNVISIATSIVAIGGAITTLTLILKKTKSAVKKTIEPLLNKNNGSEPEETEMDEVETQQMREDDKQLISFLEQNGGQAFERDLRKKFLLPRTTMWRAVKRLERQGIIEIEKKEFQNLVKLRKKPEEGQ